MVQTVKFSEFPGPSAVLSTDIVVGLRGGENYQFTGVGSGGGGAGVTRSITQVAHGLVVGNYVRINSSGLYVKTLADTPQNAELSGLVIAVADANTFTLQVVGYVAAGVFAGLTAGSVYFLSDVALGAHSLTEPSVNGEVSLPVFWAETSTTGYLRQSRGIINGGQPPAGGGGGSNPSVVIIVQPAHGFVAGQVLYVQAAGLYALAQANTLAKASAVGIVISVTDANTFTLQTDDYQSGYITGKVGASIYYLDPAVAGGMTTVRPTTVGQYIKQIYIAETATTGYIQETQPIEILTPEENIITITQAGHGLTAGSVVYISAANTYTRAVANALATASAVGIVTSVIDVNTFVLQTSGYQTGLITGKVAAGIYYLDPVTPGAMTLVQPIAIGQYIKQIYIAEAANSGYIQETQPIAITAPVGGSGWTVISTINVVAGAPSVDIINMAGFYRYMIVIENLIPTLNAWLRLRTSINNGATFDAGGADYAWGSLYNAALYYAPADVGIQFSNSNPDGVIANAIPEGGISGFVQIINPANATRNKVFEMQTSYWNQLGAMVGGSTTSGVRLSTAAINAVQLIFTAGTTCNSGTVKLLGTNA